MPYIVSGTVRINGTPVRSGSVEIWAFDGSGDGELITTTGVSVGLFSATVPDNTRDYRAIFDDGKNRGVSILATPTGTAPALLPAGAIAGDSQAVGIGLTDKVDRGANVTAAFSHVQLTSHTSTSFTDPLVYTDVGPRDTQPYFGGGGSTPGMGVELSLARGLYSAFGVDFPIVKRACDGTSADEWLPTATVPTAGNMLSLLDADMNAIDAGSTKIGWLYLSLGTNDASDATLSANYLANMRAIIAHLRIARPNLWVVIPKLDASCSQAHTATIRAAQVTLAGDTKVIVLDNDDVGLGAGDGLHNNADEYVTIGQRAARAIADAMSIAQPANAGAAPEFIAGDVGQYGTGVLKPRSGAAGIDGDLEIMVMTDGLVGASIALATAQGYTLAASVTSAFSGLDEQLAVFSRPVAAGSFVNGRMPTPITTDNNNLNAAVSFYVRGNPGFVPVIEASQVAANNADGTSLTMGGVPTSGANRLIVCISAGYVGGANSNSMANAGLTSFTKQRDSLYNIGSDFQLLTVYTGVQPTTTANTGNTTLTSTAAAIHTAVTLAIKAA